jgi:putative aminopeptidase FrvX
MVPADADRYARRHCHAGAHRDCNCHRDCYRDRHRHRDHYCHRDRHRDCYRHRDRHCHWHDHARSVLYCDQDRHTDANEHKGDSAHRYRNPYGHHAADSDGDPDYDADLYADGDADAPADSDGDPDHDADLYADVHSHLGRTCHPHTDAGVLGVGWVDENVGRADEDTGWADENVGRAEENTGLGVAMDTVALLKRLSEAVGLSGYERPVRILIKEELGRYADEVRTDKMGNLIALKRGTPSTEASIETSVEASIAPEEGGAPRRRIMLAAHMDEIGLMVTGVEEGFLRIAPVGGLDGRLLSAQPVTVHGTVGGQHDLPGIIASVPPHLLPDHKRGQVVPIEKLFVDVGLPPDEVAERVCVGDLVSFRQEALELKGGLLTGKALDNRAAVAAVAICLELLSGMRHTWDVYAVATVQEEVGLKGALTSAFDVDPDVAIAVDVTWGEQSGAPQDRTFPMGKGPTIGIGPNFHPALHQALVDTAKTQEIPYHVEPLPGSSGTDAWAIQISREGVPTALLSIPERYMHSPVEVIAVKDVERSARLMAHFVASLTPDFLETLTLHPEE